MIESATYHHIKYISNEKILQYLHIECKELKTQLKDVELEELEREFLQYALNLVLKRIDHLSNKKMIIKDDENLHLKQYYETKKLLHDHDYYTYYQYHTGQYIFIHSLNYRMLLYQYNILPSTIIGQVIEIKHYIMNDENRKKFRFLSHLPISTSFTLILLDIKHNKSTLKYFAKELNLLKQRIYKKKQQQQQQLKQLKQQDSLFTSLLKQSSYHGKLPINPIHLTKQDNFPTLKKTQQEEKKDDQIMFTSNQMQQPAEQQHLNQLTEAIDQAVFNSINQSSLSFNHQNKQVQPEEEFEKKKKQKKNKIHGLILDLDKNLI